MYEIKIGDGMADCGDFNGHIYFALTAPIVIKDQKGKSHYVTNRPIKEAAKLIIDASKNKNGAFYEKGDRSWNGTINRIANYLKIIGRTSKGNKYTYNSADKNETGTKCISKKFVHDRRYGLVSGTCQHATGFRAFEECAEK